METIFLVLCARGNAHPLRPLDGRRGHTLCGAIANQYYDRNGLESFHVPVFQGHGGCPSGLIYAALGPDLYISAVGQRWGRVREESTNDETRERARMSAVETQGFKRMVRCKNLIWERDSLARTTYDPEHIPDCNVDATVGKHFLFPEPIPRSENGQGYLRVTRSSLWWQQREFPNLWTSEGLTTCVEKGYKWSIHSTTWNHLQAMWLS